MFPKVSLCPPVHQNHHPMLEKNGLTLLSVAARRTLCPETNQVLTSTQEEETRRRNWELSAPSSARGVNSEGDKGRQHLLLGDNTRTSISGRSSYGIDGRKHEFNESSSAGHLPPALNVDAGNKLVAADGGAVEPSRSQLLLAFCVDHHEKVAEVEGEDNLNVGDRSQGRSSVRAEYQENDRRGHFDATEEREQSEGKGKREHSEGKEGELEEREKETPRNYAHRTVPPTASRETKNDDCAAVRDHDAGGDILLSTSPSWKECSSPRNKPQHEQLSYGNSTSAHAPESTNTNTLGSSSRRTGQQGHNADAGADSDESWSSSEEETCGSEVGKADRSARGVGGGGDLDDWAGSEAYGSDDDCTAYDQHERASIRLKSVQAVTRTTSSTSGGRGGGRTLVAAAGAGEGGRLASERAITHGTLDTKHYSNDRHSFAGRKQGEGVVPASPSLNKISSKGLAMKSSAVRGGGSGSKKLRKIQEARHLARRVSSRGNDQPRPAVPLHTEPRSSISRGGSPKPDCYKYSKGRRAIVASHHTDLLEESAMTALRLDDDHGRRRRCVAREREHIEGDDPLLRSSFNRAERRHRGGIMHRDSSSRHDDEKHANRANMIINNGTCCMSGTCSISDGGDVCDAWVEREFRARVDAARQQGLQHDEAGEQERPPVNPLPVIVSRGNRSVAGFKV